MDNVLLGFFIGWVTTMVIFPPTYVVEYRKTIAQCEKSLPRDQHCVITAVPK